MFTEEEFLNLTKFMFQNDSPDDVEGVDIEVLTGLLEKMSDQFGYATWVHMLHDTKGV